MDVLLNSPCLLFHFLTQLVEGQVLDKVKLYLLRQTLSSRQKCSISTFRDKKMTYFNVLCPKKMSNFNVLPQREGNTEMKFSLSLFLSCAPFPHSLTISSQPSCKTATTSAALGLTHPPRRGVGILALQRWPRIDSLPVLQTEPVINNIFHPVYPCFQRMGYTIATLGA